MRVRVRHSVGDLADRFVAVAAGVKTSLPGIATDAGDYGRDLAKALAREKAGPHGATYHKRITSEKRGPLTAEYGPEGIPKTDFVGVGFRHGRNTDLPQSADKAGPEMASDVRKMLARVFG